MAASNVTFLPASGASLSIGSPATITVTSGKTINEVLLYQTVTDPTDTWLSYSTESPFSITYTPSRMGTANFTAFAVFSDNTYATTTLQYTLEPTGTSFGLQLTNLPAGSMVVSLPAIVGVQAGYKAGYVDVSSLATYSTGSGGASVFSVTPGGNVTPSGPGVDVLNVSYNGMAISAPISVGSCVFSLGPLNQLVPFSGGSASVNVTATPGCSWTAQVDQAWLSLTGGSGTGSGTITAVAQANTSGANQTAFVTLAGQDVAVIQPAAACTYVVFPTSLTLPASGGSGTLSVTTACPTPSSSDEAWANVTTLSSASVAYNVDANTSLTSRSASLTVGTQDVPLIEAAAVNSTPTVMVTPSASSITTTQALTVAVAVSGGTGNPTPTGTVTLSSGSYSSAATVVNNGIATISVPAGSLTVGTDALTATYSGDNNYNTTTGTAAVAVTTAVNPSFTLSGTAVTVTPGATTANTSTITLTPAGGFTGSVSLTASVTSSPTGAQYPPTLSFGSTSTVSIASAAETATLSISTTAASSAALVHPQRPGVPWYAAEGTALACILLFGIPKRRRRWQSMLGLLALFVVFSGSVLACGGRGGTSGGSGGRTSNPGTTAGTYTVTVTGTSGATITTGTFTLTVQ